jgi:transcriptional regulator with XRE-family HTH domain
MPARQKVAAQRRVAFGSRVRALRTARGWSQERLAHEAGLDRTYVGSVERGERNIALDNIWLLADTLGVAPADLVGDK